MGTLKVKSKDKGNFSIEYQGKAPSVICVDVTDDTGHIADTIDRAGRLYNQLAKDYPEIDIANTPKASRINSETMWYVQMFEDYYKYIASKPNSQTFAYNHFLKWAVTDFKIYNSVRSFFDGKRIAEIYSYGLGIYGQSAKRRKLDMTELIAPDFSSFKSTLGSKAPWLNSSGIECIVNSLSRHLRDDSHVANGSNCADYAAVIMKERERRHGAERDEMLRELRAANRWK